MRYTLFVAFLCSAVLCHSQQSPLDIPGLHLWVRADSNVVTASGGRVTDWGDMSGNNNHLTQVTNNYRPILTNGLLNGHAGIVFDGSNDNLFFPQSAEIRTVFWVMEENAAATLSFRCLLGDDDKFDFLRGAAGEIWNTQFTNAGILGGVTRANYQEIDGVNNGFPDGVQLMSLQTTSAVEASRLTMDRATISRVWHGVVYELLIFNSALDDEQIAFIENYLADYYSGAVLDLGEDLVIEDGFCAIDLTAQPGFQSYEWNDGSTGASLQVNNTGTYWVNATDVFGRVLSDTVHVTFPGAVQPPSTIVACLGDSVQWDLQLDPGVYDFSWNDGNTEGARWFSEPGAYSVSVTDGNGCVLNSDEFNLSIDLFSALDALIPTQTLCAGNVISIESLNDTFSVEWEDGSANAEFTIFESGSYSVILQNDNGCLLYDTTEVSVAGLAPEVVILEPPIYCQNQVMGLTGSAVADSPIASWEWLIGGAESYSGQQISFTPVQFGIFDADLTVTTEAGCSTQISIQGEVHPAPTGNLMYTLPCSGQEVMFSTQPQIAQGAVFDATWSFQGSTADGFEVTFTAADAGFDQASVTFFSVAGCSQTVNQLLQVYETPSISIQTENVCAGDLVQFEGLSNGPGGPISAWYWWFGDNTASTQQNVAHLYPGSGNFNVVLTATATSGCAASVPVSLTVYPLPHANFEVSNACLGTPYQINETSTTAVDPIVAWDWTVGGETPYSGQFIAPIFNALGFVPVNLLVTTENGCTDDITRQIPVFELPEVGFTFSPEIGSAPLEVEFVNSSESGLDLMWYFGDGTTSELQQPSHVFSEDGEYEVTLEGTNVYGCAANVSQSVLVTNAISDLKIISIDAQQSVYGLQCQMLVQNAGNYPVTQVVGSVEIDGQRLISEVFDVYLAPGFVGLLTFTGYLPGTGDANVVCIEISENNALASEQTPADNLACSALQAGPLLLDVFPVPLGEGQTPKIRVIMQTAEVMLITCYSATGQLVYAYSPLQLEEGYHLVELDEFRPNTGLYHLQFETSKGVEIRSLIVD
ncbi:MAG: PKD domain-containing protein [Cryomorphaceae bacterium]|nr:PKD domain-containing protein [Cryomorphaceae bacterium]